MINPLKQAPLDKYFVSPVIVYAPQPRKRKPRISGMSSFVKHFQTPDEENGLFITKSAREEDLLDVFANYGPVKSVRVLDRYAFVLFEDGVDISSAVGKHYDIGGRCVYVDRIRGKDPRFIPLRSRRKMNLWHDYIDKFK